jgi:hypothetical protein
LENLEQQFLNEGGFTEKLYRRAARRGGPRMNAPRQHDIARWSAAEEGPFFERKSALDRSGACPKQRKAADIAHDIAETLVAFANADGGELVIGMENDERCPACLTLRTS